MRLGRSTAIRRRRFGSAVLLLLGLWAGALGLRANEAFRFAWLSDTHVGSATAADDLRAAVRDINTLTNIAFVVISGDITEYGSRAQLLLAREILSQLTIPCHLVPGNHDTKWSESGATDFPRVFGADRFMFEHGGYRFIGLHQGPLMRMGDGHFAPQDLRWLDEVLAETGDQPVIFVTHYPLDDSIDNWFEALNRLKRANTQVALVGHGHANHKLDFEGVPGVMGRSNLRARQPAGGFTLVEVTGDRMTFAEQGHGASDAKQWHSVMLGKRDYAGDTNTYPRPDFSVNGEYPFVKPRWQHLTGWAIVSAPAVGENSAIAGDASGAVTALALDSGRPRWTFRTEAAVCATPAIAGGRVVVPSADGTVYALDVTNGTELWRFTTGRPIVASPCLSNGVVYLGSSEGKFRALDLETGRLRWEFSGLRGFVETRPLIHGDRVIFGAWDGNLYALNAGTGEPAWKWHGDKPGVLLSPAACWPVAAAGRVFVVAPDRMMTAIDADTGAQVWRTGDCEVRESIGLSEDGRRVYVRAMNDWFRALATEPAQPETVWETNGHFGYDINSAMLIEKDGAVFYGTKNGVLFALDARTGAVRWRHKLGTGVLNTVVPLNSHQVVATDFDGRIALIESSE